MKKFIYIILISFLWACSPEELIKPYPCVDGDCNSFFQIDPQVSPGVYQDENGYWHIEYYGPKYFTIMGQLDELDEYYEVNNVPLVEVAYDSDYWIAFDSISFQVPIYSVLSWFSNGDWNNLIPIGNQTYTLTDIARIQPPLNIAGYQIQKNFCWECPYAPTLLGTYSKYNYNPRQQFYLNNTMVGDTLKVMTKVMFASEYLDERIIQEHEFNIIVE